jgi:hypothetical protein
MRRYYTIQQPGVRSPESASFRLLTPGFWLLTPIFTLSIANSTPIASISAFAGLAS